MAIRGSRSFKVSAFGTNRKPVCDFPLVNNTNLYVTLSCTFSKISRSIGQKSTTGVPFFNALVRSPEFGIAKFVLTKLETSLYYMVQNIFRYLEPFKRESRV